MLTNLSPTAGTPGGGYGSFTDKQQEGVHEGAFTQLSPTAGTPGGLYGAFIKGVTTGDHTPGPLTQLACHAGMPNGRYGAFGGKEPSVIEPEPEPTPTPPPSGGAFEVWWPPGPATQHARIHPFEQRDEYGRLRASRGQGATQRTRLHAFFEPEQWTTLRADSAFHTRLGASPHQDEFGTLAGKRGLPSMEVLALFTILRNLK